MQYLQPIYDARKSFYGKAKVYDLGYQVQLESYNTIMCVLQGSCLMLCAVDYDCTQTSMRHVKEFLLQEGVNINATCKKYGFKNLTQLFKSELGSIEVVFND